jgi:hypothetical protein
MRNCSSLSGSSSFFLPKPNSALTRTAGRRDAGARAVAALRGGSGGGHLTNAEASAQTLLEACPRPAAAGADAGAVAPERAAAAAQQRQRARRAAPRGPRCRHPAAPDRSLGSRTSRACAPGARAGRAALHAQRHWRCGMGARAVARVCAARVWGVCLWNVLQASSPPPLLGRAGGPRGARAPGHQVLAPARPPLRRPAAPPRPARPPAVPLRRAARDYTAPVTSAG